MEILQKASKLLPIIKESKPIIHHITNSVTINDCANITLAIGASPIMAYDIAEVEEVVSIASSLVINIGTLNLNSIEAMILAGKKANELDIPIILDPVGVGATKLRRRAVEKILDHVKVSIIKGNMSEIKFLAGEDVNSRGIDSIENNKGGEEVAKELALKLGCIIAISGKQDILSDGNRVFYINNGHEMLSKITGAGCMTSSLIASFCSVTKDYLSAAIGGMISMGIAGEIAFRLLKINEGIGSFKVNLFDSIYNLTSDTIIKEGDLCD